MISTFSLARPLIVSASAALLLAAASHTAIAGGDEEGSAVTVGAPVFTGRAVGCYYHRGRRYCSRYCYVEVNGLEYCHSRQSEAFPQGVVFEDVSARDHRHRKRRAYK